MAYSTALSDGVELRLTLDRYQEILRLPEAAFNGLSRLDDKGEYACDAVWKQIDRDAVAISIAEAEEMREKELGYFLAPVYTANEDIPFKNRLSLMHKLLQKFGTQTTAVLGSGVALTLSAGGVINDPVMVTVAVPAACTASEVFVYYPGDTVRINPKKVTISGGVATILIPRSRLKLMTLDGNAVEPPMYIDDANFITTVDIKRIWYDPTTAAHLVWNTGDCGDSTIAEHLQLAYPEIFSARRGDIRLIPTSYTAPDWNVVALDKNSYPQYGRVCYLSGRTASMATEIETAKLAHTLIPTFVPETMSLCQQCWKEDKSPSSPQIMTPYGSLKGAVFVWLSDTRQKIGNGGKF